MCFPRFLPWTAFLSTKHGGRRGIRAFGGAPSSEQDKPRQPLMPSGLRFNVRSSSSHASALHLRGSPKTAHRAVQFAPRSFVPILLVRKPLALLRAMPSCVTAAGCFRKRASLARGGRSRLHPRIPLFIRSAETGSRLLPAPRFRWRKERDDLRRAALMISRSTSRGSMACSLRSMREPAADKVISPSPSFSAAVVRALLAPKRKGRSAPFSLWRKERDSNPRRLSPQRFSRPPRSTAPPSFHKSAARKEQPK